MAKGAAMEAAETAEAEMEAETVEAVTEGAAREVETAVRTAKIAERARRLCEAGGDSSNDGERGRTLASLCAKAVEIVGGGSGGGACA